MVIPSIIKPPRTVVSYDYINYSTGRYYGVFFGINADFTSGVTRNKVYSGMIHHNSANSPTFVDQDTEYEMFDIDFDIPFIKPRIVEGDIYLQVPHGLHNLTAQSTKVAIKLTGQIFHYDGTTETQLGSDAVGEYVGSTSIGLGGVFSFITTLIINVPRRLFKAGETLRVTLKQTGKRTDGAGGIATAGGVGCDPNNRSDYTYVLDDLPGQNEVQVIETDQPTRMEIHIPFVPSVDIG